MSPTAGDLVPVVDGVVSIAGEESERGVLERLVDVARTLTAARFGVALLVGADGTPTALAHQGMTSTEVSVLPHLPRPVGLVGVVLTGRTLRLDDMRTHPEAVGLPSAHTPMAALLALPVTHDGVVLGALYLTRPPGHGTFDDTHEALARALARQAASRVTALRARQRTLDLVDALAPVAGGTPRGSRTATTPDEEEVSPVVRRLLAAGRATTGLEVTALSTLEGGTQTFTAVEAGPHVGQALRGLVEGSSLAAADGYCTRVLDGTVPASVPDVRSHPLLATLPVTEALGVGAYCSVPVRLPDGTLYGTVCGAGSTPSTPLTPGQLGALQTIADLIGAHVAHQHEQRRRRERERRTFVPHLDGRRRTLVLQPIVDLATGAVAGHEALSRFTDPAGAPRPPDRVFADAADLGLGVELEQAAAADALALLPHLPTGQYLSVNLSAAALLHPATHDLLAGALDPDHPRRLVVELTEHDQVRDYPTLMTALAGLRARGLLLAIDDTGAGYASLQHLTRLRPDVIKLDIAFVRAVHTDPARRAIARAVIGLSHELGATCVAEGVEDAAELAELRRLGATHAQGFHLARPAPPDLTGPGSTVPRPRTPAARRPTTTAG